MDILDQTQFKALLDKFELELRREGAGKPNDWHSAMKNIETAYANALAAAKSEPSVSPAPRM